MASNMDRTLTLTSRWEGPDLEELKAQPARSRDIGSGADYLDPRIVWVRDAAAESPAMIAGIERICREACALMKKYAVIVIRPVESNIFDSPDGPVRVRPHVEVYMGSHVHGDTSIAEMHLQGRLFYLVHTDSVFYPGSRDDDDGIPDRLAQPNDTGDYPSPNPELFEFGTMRYEDRIEDLWILVRDAEKQAEQQQAQAQAQGQGQTPTH